jgi:uncharacterized protein (DUF1778 family)
MPTSPMTKVPLRSKRLDIRTAPEPKRLLSAPQNFPGWSVTDCGMKRQLEAATEIILETEFIRLREEDPKVF